MNDYFGADNFFKENVSPIRTFPDELEAERDAIVSKMLWTLYRAEFSYKCMGGMSKRDYGRCRYTASELDHKIDLLINCKTETERKEFVDFVNRFCLPPNEFR